MYVVCFAWWQSRKGKGDSAAGIKRVRHDVSSGLARKVSDDGSGQQQQQQHQHPVTAMDMDAPAAPVTTPSDAPADGPASVPVAAGSGVDATTSAAVASGAASGDTGDAGGDNDSETDSDGIRPVVLARDDDQGSVTLLIGGNTGAAASAGNPVWFSPDRAVQRARHIMQRAMIAPAAAEASDNADDGKTDLSTNIGVIAAAVAAAAAVSASPFRLAASTGTAGAGASAGASEAPFVLPVLPSSLTQSRPPVPPGHPAAAVTALSTDSRIHRAADAAVAAGALLSSVHTIGSKAELQLDHTASDTLRQDVAYDLLTAVGSHTGCCDYRRDDSNDAEDEASTSRQNMDDDQAASSDTEFAHAIGSDGSNGVPNGLTQQQHKVRLRSGRASCCC